MTEPETPGVEKRGCAILGALLMTLFACSMVWMCAESVHSYIQGGMYVVGGAMASCFVVPMSLCATFSQLFAARSRVLPRALRLVAGATGALALLGAVAVIGLYFVLPHFYQR